MEEAIKPYAGRFEVSFPENFGFLANGAPEKRGTALSFAFVPSRHAITRVDTECFEGVLACRYCGSVGGDSETCGECREGAESQKVRFLFGVIPNKKRTGSDRLVYRETMGSDWQKIFTSRRVSREGTFRVSKDLAKEIVQAIPQSTWMPFWETCGSLTQRFRRLHGFYASEVSKVYVFIR